MKQLNKKIISGLALAGLGGLSYAWLNCRKVKIPDYVTAVENFDPQQYMGKWYEIARLDFKYEKNMSHVTATYFLNKKGVIEVHNRGFDDKENEWTEAHGKAKLNGEEGKGALKVSFFGPFYSGYNVIAIDEAYTYALVAGNNLAYLWILSRTPTIPESIKKEYVQKAKSIGYNTDNLIWVEHNINQ